MERGRLISIEGIDGAGKTTVAGRLVDALSERGVPARLLREPGGVELAERVRELVKDPALQIGDRAEALLYAAARAQLVEEALRPALEAGEWIVLDRYLDSSLVYQGAGRGLGIEAVRAVNEFGTGGLVADRTVLLRIDPAAGRARQEDRGAADRLERSGEDFYAAIAAAYDRLAAGEPERVRVVDASADPDAVLAGAIAAVEDLLPSS